MKKAKKINIFKQLTLLPAESNWTILDQDWFGEELPFETAFAITSNSEALKFSARGDFSSRSYPNSKCGDYIEGLWEYDVAELFLMFGSGEYLEINLGTTGAYWAQLFSSYRERSSLTLLKKEDFVVSNTCCDSFWESSITLPLNVIPEIVAIHCSFIISDNLGKERFISSNPVKTEPDFHHRDCFMKIEIID